MHSESKSSTSSNGNESFSGDGLLPPTVDFDSLRRYTSSKLSIANQLRGLLDLLKKRGDEARVQSCEQLMVKLAEDRFTIAVLGQFKRGKSSLLNARQWDYWDFLRSIHSGRHPLLRRLSAGSYSGLCFREKAAGRLN